MTSPGSEKGNPSAAQTGSRGLCLLGFMGSGKSTLGRLAAAELAWPFVDLDSVLAARHGAVADQIRLEGEPVFRARERQAAAELCDGELRVLSLGGGAWMDPQTRAAVGARYLTVWLRAPLAVLRARVQGSDRPLWDDRVEERLRSREPVYALAERAVDVDRAEPEALARLLAGLARGEGT